MTEQKIDPNQVFQAFDVSNLDSLVQNAVAQKEVRDEIKAASGDGFINDTFLPPGTHTMRIFADPEGQLFRHVKVFQQFKPTFMRITDPRLFKQADGTYKSPNGTEYDDETIQRIWTMCKGLHHSKDSWYGVLFYAYLIETDAKDDKYWKPGTLYVVNGNTKLEASLLSQLSEYRNTENVREHIADSLNPTKEGWAWKVTHVKGQSGSTNAVLGLFKPYPAIEIDSKYKPLSEVYASPNTTAEELSKIFEYLEAQRKEAGLDDDGNTDDVPTPQSQSNGASNTVTNTDSAAAPANTTSNEQSSISTGATNPEAAAAFFQAGAQQAQQAQTTTEDSVETKEETYGLTPEQVANAKEKGVDLKVLASAMGLI